MTGTTGARRSSTGPVSLIWDLSIEVAAARDGWLTIITRNGEEMVAEPSKTKPWLDSRLPGRVTKRISEVDESLKENPIKKKIVEYFEDMRGSPDTDALTSEPVARAVGATVRVLVELTDPPAYHVELEGGETLTFSSREMAALKPITLNERWIASHPRSPLKATRNDFEEIQEYWLSIAEETEPLGAKSVWEDATERLQTLISTRKCFDTPVGLIEHDSGLYLEEGGPLWVSNALIKSILREDGKSETDSSFAKYLQKCGVVVAESKSFRVNKAFRRAWGFNPEFNAETYGATVVSDIPRAAGGEEV